MTNYTQTVTERELIRDTADCPTCGAKAGRPCVYSGKGAAKKMAKGQNHHERQKLSHANRLSHLKLPQIE